MNIKENLFNILGCIPVVGLGVGIGRIAREGFRIHERKTKDVAKDVFNPGKKEPFITKKEARHLYHGLCECVPIAGPLLYGVTYGLYKIAKKIDSKFNSNDNSNDNPALAIEENEDLSLVGDERKTFASKARCSAMASSDSQDQFDATALEPDGIKNMDKEAVQKIPPKTFRCQARVYQQGVFSAQQIAAFTAEQTRYFTAAQVKALDFGFFLYLSPEAFCGIHCVEAIAPDLLVELLDEEIEGSDVGSDNGSDKVPGINALSIEQIGKLTAEQLTAINENEYGDEDLYLVGSDDKKLAYKARCSAMHIEINE